MRKNKIRKLVSISLAMLTVLSFTACGSSSKKTDTATLKDVSFPLKETATLKMLTSAPSISTQDPNERIIFQRLEKETNVHIDWTCYTDDQFPDKKNLALSKKDTLPDVVFNAGMNNNDLLRYSKQGVIIPVEDLITKYMPNLSKVLEEKPEYKKMITAPDGHIYSFPWIEELGSGKEAIQAVGDIPWINKKWLDELGLQVPKTTDELVTVLKAFRDKHPEGKTDVIPMSFIINAVGGNEDPGFILGAFGLGDNGDHYMVTNDKKVVYSTTQDGYKEGINWLHKLQEEGLIDPEAFTQKWDTFVAKGKNDRYGMFFTWDRANIAANKDDYIPLPALAGPNGTVNATRSNGYGFDLGRCVVTSANKNLELTAKWIDKLYAPLQSIQDNWGTYGDEKNQNVFELTENKTLKHLQLGTASPWEVRANQFVSGPLAVLDSYYGKYTTSPDDAQERLDILHKTYVKDMKADYNYPPVFMSQEDIEKLTQYETAVKAYTERKKAEWILNGGIDEEWDSYLKEMDNQGLSKILEIKQKYLDLYFAK
ncbi:extracellular solute-binding protein [Clostridium beijerinckii]|uniref:extracellular solute-binding protein n=1 Tax=Clostridium beijerinckii TaxID=1520 RepID=UPI00157141CA|nr:extracellular solute-binding protein [Clostridium beijerinckii]NRT73226.1 putative aldouronate transport system substrate-binding protein [Clostridium beijerinckii]